MSKFFEVDFRTGSAIDKIRGISPIATGSPKIVKQNLGRAVATKSNTDILNYSTNTVPLSGPMSIVAFAKGTNKTQRYNIISNNSYTNSITFQFSSGNFLALYREVNNHRTWYYAPDEKPHCFIFTIPGEEISAINNAECYVDNIKLIIATTASTDVPASRSTLSYVGGGNVSVSYPSFISYIATYDHVLTEQERNDIYADFLRSYPTHKKQTQIEYSKPNDLSREKDSVISSNLLLPGTTTNYYANDVAAWILYGSNTKTQDGNAVKIDYVSSALGAYCLFRASSNTVAANPFVGVKYKLKFRYKVTGTLDIRIYNGATFVTYAGQTNTDWVEREAEFFCAVADNCYMAFLDMSAGESVWVEFLELKSYQGLVIAYNCIPFRNTLVDVSNNNYNATLAGIRQIKKGILLKGNSSTDRITHANLDLSNKWSIAIRIGAFSDFSSSSVLFWIGRTVFNCFNLYKFSTPRLSFRDSASTYHYFDASSYTSIVNNLEKDIVLVSNGTNIKLYINGEYNSQLSTTPSSTTVSLGIIRNVSSISEVVPYELIDYRVYNLELSEQQIKDYHNSFAKQVYLQEDFSNNGADGTVKVPYGWYKGTGSYKISSGNVIKYLECTTAGTIALPSKQAYGTWEFDWYKGADANMANFAFINNLPLVAESSFNGFRLYCTSAENIVLSRLPVGAVLFNTVNSYISNFTWYRFKITRKIDGTIAVYIKGGSFGNEYVLVTVNSGSNPITDTNNTTSNFFVVDLDAGDRIANITMRKGIEV